MALSLYRYFRLFLIRDDRKSFITWATELGQIRTQKRVKGEFSDHCMLLVGSINIGDPRKSLVMTS